MSDDMSMGLPSSAGEHGVLRSMQEVAMSSRKPARCCVLTILPGGAITTMTLTSWATSACADGRPGSSRRSRAVSENSRSTGSASACTVLFPTDPAAPFAFH